jgi:alpha-ketoglutarate-dependent 2,4-dichlorophenoxyacetate dioxygenase
MAPAEEAQMALTIHKLRDDFGAEIFGVDITKPIDDATFAEIRRAFDDYSVLVFHDQPFDDESQIAFSRRFGPLETTIKANTGGGTFIADISNVDPETDRIIPVDGWRSKYNSGNEMWHSDSSFKPVLAQASLLSGREVPPEGAETEFASMRTAYDRLGADEKAKLDGLVAVHDFSYSRGLVDPKLLSQDDRDAVPPVRHAVVRANPANGRKAY